MSEIAAALVWYDEPLESLDRCIRSLAGVADTIIAVDGRWDGFADETLPWSPIEQTELLDNLALELELRLHLIVETATRPWSSQIAKRAHAYYEAAAHADWVLVIDADEWIEHKSDRFRERLDEVDAKGDLVATIACRTETGPMASMGTRPLPRLFSTRYGLTVSIAHNGIQTLDGRWLAGDHAYVNLETSSDLSADLRIFHDQGKHRPKSRELADREYRRHRSRAKLEKWVRA